MKRTLLSLLSVIMLAGAQAQTVPYDYMDKYATLEGLSGVTLFDAIAQIAADGYRTHSYKDLWTFFRTTDATADGKVWDTYSDCQFTFGNDQCGTYSGVCDCYNREHSLPKSWFGGSDSNAPGTDLFHLMPTDGKVNGQRSNYAFGECAGGNRLNNHAQGRLGSSTFPGYTNVGTVFEPDDIYKGDFARNYFGMLVRYGKSFALNQADGGMTMFSNSGRNITAANHYGLTEYSVALLMKWHEQDPVSSKETDRNNGIQQTQGNRNPFIDCPVLADYFWGEKAGQALDINDLLDCGCVQFVDPPLPDEPTAVDIVFPSLTLTTAGGRIMLTCLPQHAQISVLNAAGTLIEVITCDDPETEFSLPQGFYLVVVASGNEQKAFKVMLR